MSTARIGVETERALRKQLEKLGYQVIRSAASKGPWDLVAVGHQEIRLIQVKRADRMTDVGIAKERTKVAGTNPQARDIRVTKELHWKIKRGAWDSAMVAEWDVPTK